MLDAWAAAFDKDKARTARKQQQQQQQDAPPPRRRRRSGGGMQAGSGAAASSAARRKSRGGGREEQGDAGDDEVEVVVVPRPCVHEVVLRDQALFMSPPLAAAEARWVAQLHGWVFVGWGVGVYDETLCIQCLPRTSHRPHHITHTPTPSPPPIHSLLAVVCHLPRLRSSRFGALLLEMPAASSSSLGKGASSDSATASSAAGAGGEETEGQHGTFADLPRSLPKAALAKVRRGCGCLWCQFMRSVVEHKASQDAVQDHHTTKIDNIPYNNKHDMVSQDHNRNRQHTYIPYTTTTNKPTQAYGAIKALVGEADTYVQEWLQYQSLWDMGARAAEARLGEDLEVRPSMPSLCVWCLVRGGGGGVGGYVCRYVKTVLA